MKNMNYNISVKTVVITDLKQSELLRKYKLAKATDFEIQQLNKFGLSEWHDRILVTSSNIVLCNYEAVLIAKANNQTEIEVVVIEELTEDEIPQVVCLKNLRKSISKVALVELIVDYREYLTKNDAGKIWAAEIPGDSTDHKIGVLLGYSYGMIFGYIKIYKNKPELLKSMDAGDLSFTGAMEIINNENTSPIKPVISKAPKYNYAGERNMVPCEPMKSIQIEYVNGKTIEIQIEGNKGTCDLFDQKVESIYSSKMESFKGGAEFHRLDFIAKNQFIELVIKQAA